MPLAELATEINSGHALVMRQFGKALEAVIETSLCSAR
jgi:hypothetical protein